MSGTTRRQLLFSGITAFAGLAAAVIDLAGLVGASPFWSVLELVCGTAAGLGSPHCECVPDIPARKNR